MNKSNAKSLVLLFVLTMLTKVFGFLKTTITAAYFGMSVQTDIYNLADGVINQVFYAFTISISVIIVPLFLKKMEESETAGKRFAKTAYISMILFGAVLGAFVVFLSPWLAQLLGREYEADHIQLLSQYMQVLAMGIVLTLITNTIQSLLNAERVYGFPSVCAMIHSVVIIAFAVVFSEVLGVWALVLSVPVAYVIQMVFLRIKARNYLSHSIRKNGFDRDIKMLFVSMIPVFLSNATMEINGFLDKYILAGLEEGAVTAVSYSMVLLVFATNIISIPVTTVLFTDVSELCGRQEYDKVRSITEQTLVNILMICIPIMVITSVCADKIVGLVYGYGKFTESAVNMTAVALSGFGLSIVFYVLKDTINRVSYALLETKLPMIVGIISTAVHIAAAVLLSRYMGMMGVVWATVISVGLTALVTLCVLSKKYLHCNFGAYAGSLLKIAVSTVVMIVLVILLRDYVCIHFFTEKIDLILNLTLYAGVGFVGYFAILLFMREPFIMALSKNIMRRFLRKQ